MNFNADYFTLFGLPKSFRQEMGLLDSRYLEAQIKVHPDKFAQAGKSEQRQALQSATRVNEAYRTLKKPLSRARYLLSISGFDLEEEGSAPMSADFLVEQISWRETIEHALDAENVAELDATLKRIKDRMGEGFDEIAVLLDDKLDYSAAAGEVRRLMFFEKLRSDTDEAIASLEIS